MINVHHSTFDMNHQVINPKESTKVHLRNFTPPLHGLCFIPLSLEGNHADRYTTDAIILAIDFNYIS